MKTTRLFKSLSGITLSAVAMLALNGCGNSSSTSQSAPPVNMVASAKPSAEPTSFNNVAAHLDSGGNLYVYLSTEQWLEKLSDGVSQLRGIFDSIPQGSTEDHERIGKVFDVVTGMIKESGIEDVSGFGMSSIATEKGFYRTKSMLHHYKGKGDGFMWTMFGSKAHALDVLDMLPATTAMAMSSDLDMQKLWTVIQGQVKNLDMPQVSDGMNKFASEFQKNTKMDWNKMLASLGGEYGLVITLDDSKKIPVPMGNDKLEVPTPGIIIIAKMNDETIFDRIEMAMGEAGLQVVKVDEAGLKMRTTALPLQIPIELRPTVAMVGGYMIIASTDSLVREMLAVKSGKTPGLKSTDEFKKLSEGVPVEGNAFSFVSQRFAKTIYAVQSQMLSNLPQGAGAQMGWLKSFMNPDLAAHSFGVSASTDEGWVSVGNGNQNPANALLLVPVAFVGMMSAIAIPNFVKARSTAQRMNCINNLKQINLAKEMWAMDHNKKAGDSVTMADILQDLGGKPMVCPQGGTYNIGKIGENPTCSIPGHVMP